MEGIPTPESLPTKEFVIDKIRELGKTEETIALVTAFHEALRKSESTGLDSARTQAEMVDFYIEMGDLDGAEEALTDALKAANNEDNEELYLFIQSKLIELDRLRS